MLNYIIVGAGLAATAFIQQLRKQKRSFIVISDDSYQSSMVAGGLYNPVILKRFTASYNAWHQTKLMRVYYNDLEDQFKGKYIYDTPLLRKFSSIEEQNNWFAAGDHPVLSHFLDPDLKQINNVHVPAAFGFGKVNHSGWVDVKQSLSDIRGFLLSQGLLINESFDYKALVHNEEQVVYKSFHAEKIVFCEGFGVINNLFFNVLPMVGTKGELITIESKELKLEQFIKSNLFIIPLGNDLYKVGATYHWDDKSPQPTLAGKSEIIKDLDQMINCPYTIIKHEAEIRPTTKDRQPFVGQHPLRRNLFILNGLGTRGVVQAPDLALALYNFIEFKIELPKEIDIKRLKKIAWI
jgi:glycine/D-amino acid oxidase-like deaminating enzyme